MVFEVGAQTVLHAQHEGPEAGAVQHALADEIERHVQIAGIEDLQLRHHAGAADHAGHLAHVGRRIHDNVAARVHRVQVEGTDIRAQRRDVFHPLGGCSSVVPRAATRGSFSLGHETAAGPVVRLMIRLRCFARILSMTSA